MGLCKHADSLHDGIDKTFVKPIALQIIGKVISKMSRFEVTHLEKLKDKVVVLTGKHEYTFPLQTLHQTFLFPQGLSS